MRTVMRRLAPAILVALPCAAALGQSQLPGEPATSQTIHTDVLVEPRPARPISMSYPKDEIEEEGWVQLGFMVAATGKPFEVTVNSSSGNRVFERQAVAAIERSAFTPGLLNGQPIDSATQIKVVFQFATPSTGARTEFIQEYTRLEKAIRAKDRAAADASMKRLDVKNLYEDAFLGLVSYAYALEWGNESQQLADLQRAIAHENAAKYLRKDAFQAVRVQALILDVKLRRYAEAMDLWRNILKSLDPATIEKIKPIVNEIERVRISGEPYDISGAMPEGNWQVQLFERNFRIRVAAGHVSQVKLRCARGFVRFAFDPAIEYQIERRYGNCEMELDGDPGTTFTITQFSPRGG
ncbi:MAG TPA: energy transducer TonB [Steroidobacteraceae bacterium]